MDIDLLVDGSPENQARVRKSLEVLPDKAVREMAEDDLDRYVVMRVGDEITVDLMASACGKDIVDRLFLERLLAANDDRSDKGK